MANDDKVETLDKEVQTMLRCMPHFLTANQNSSVVQDNDCQTAISAKPTTSLTCMLTVLEYADPETFRMEEVHQDAANNLRVPQYFNLVGGKIVPGSKSFGQHGVYRQPPDWSGTPGVSVPDQTSMVPSECEDMYPSRVPELDTENSNLAEIFNYSDVIDGVTDVDELFNLLLTQEDGSGNPLFNKGPLGENSEWDDDVILEEEEEEGEYAEDSDDKPSEPDDKPNEPAQPSNTPNEPNNKSADPDKTPDDPKSKPVKRIPKYIEPSD